MPAAKRKSHLRPKRRLQIEPLERRELLAVSFEFNYVEGDAVGFNDPVAGPTYRAALESAASRLGSWLLHDETIVMDVSSYPFDGTSIGGARSVGGIRPVSGGFVHNLIPKKITTGYDNNGDLPDGSVEIYFFGPDDVFSYQTDPSQGIADDQIDFQAVIIHEIAHTLGFTSATNASGADDSGNGLTTPGIWSMFDQFVSDVDGNRLIDGDPNSPTAFQMNSAAWAIHSTGGKGPNAGLFFDGPTAKSVYGGRVPLYSPAIFQVESSVAHLDSEGYPNDDYIFAPITHLMSHTLVDRAVPQELTLLEKAILTDVGLLVKEDVPPVITAPANLTLEADAPSGYTGPEDPFDEFIASVIVTDLLDANPSFSFSFPSDRSLGSRPITLTATDLSGNTSVVEPNLIIVDSTPPSLEVTPVNTVVEADRPEGFPFSDLSFSAQMNDLVDQSPSLTNDAPINLPLGTNTITFRATDFSDNQTTQIVTVRVEDTTPPIFNPPDQLQVGSNATNGADLSNLQELPILHQYASDTVDQSLTITATPDFIPPGSSEVLFTVIDDSGNQAAATVNVHVSDSFDFGDAPAIFPVTLNDDGARHAPSSLFLGNTIDFDLDGIFSDDASGDGSDEDGIEILTTLVVPSNSPTLASWTLNSTELGKIDAWIDFNRDGDWNDPNEQVHQSINVQAGINLLSFTVPAGSSVGQTFARFRLSSDGNLAPTGFSEDGEVEDYSLNLVSGSQSTAALANWVTHEASLSLTENGLELQQSDQPTFSSDPADVGSLSINGNELDQLIAVTWDTEQSAQTTSLSMDGISHVNTIHWLGGNSLIDLTTEEIFSVTRFPIHYLLSAEQQRIRIDQAAVDRLSPLTKQLTVRVAQNNAIEIADFVDWRMGAPRQVEGVWYVSSQHTSANGFELLVEPASHWNNILHRSDINNDGQVTAGDALKIINELVARRFSDEADQSVVPISEVTNWPNLFFDQNSDNRITALDALQVINDIVRNNLSGGSGELIDRHDLNQLKRRSHENELWNHELWNDELRFERNDAFNHDRRSPHDLISKDPYRNPTDSLMDQVLRHRTASSISQPSSSSHPVAQKVLSETLNSEQTDSVIRELVSHLSLIDSAQIAMNLNPHALDYLLANRQAW